MRRVWEYLVLVSKLWGKEISGPVLVLIGLALLAAEQLVTDQQTAAVVLKASAALTLSAAIVLFFSAQYKAWRDEHEARTLAELKLNAAADVRGEIWVLVPQSPEVAGNCMLRYGCDCANHGRKECQLSSALIEVHPPLKPWFNVLDRFPPQSVRTIAPGEQFRYEGIVPIPKLTCAELDRSDVTIILTDSIGVQYRNAVTKRL